MKKLTPKKNLSLSWKIGLYLSSFSIFLVIIVFLFQAFLLEPMYEASKKNTVETVSNMIVDKIYKSNDKQELADYINQMQESNETCIRVLKESSVYENTYEDTSVESDGGNLGCKLYHLSLNEIASQITKAELSDTRMYLSSQDTNLITPTSNEKLRNITLTRIIDTDQGKIAVMVYSNITPISSTKRILSSQLWYVLAIILLAVVVLTYLMYHTIARPLILINQSAKTLPSGKYVKVKIQNYREAQELDETLTNAAQDIQKADKAKRDLIANVSHDLRTPLTMITGYGEMMKDLPEEKTDENIQVIIDESKRLNALVNDLLDLSKLQEKKIHLSKERFDLTELIQSQLQKYDVYHLQEGYTIDVNLVKNTYIEADKGRIEQVFNNFMTNAIHYSGDQKHIVITQKVEDNNVIVSIQDFGDGIDDKDIEKIWDRYYKVDKEHARASSGSGIGLSIVKEILELHGAQYGVTSKLHEGSTFWFKFPMIK
ncbi:MAG: HAMP domain-containing histidine kinase [Erysipelotrichaceae bacterium]|nr:HAMP domain-containing histidine kinase [Erysipelotrichaceae bacterium]MDY6034542.1 HAMP domain-containing sensor histidine kinase [Bulleidia sp.]